MINSFIVIEDLQNQIGSSKQLNYLHFLQMILKDKGTKIFI